MASVWEHGGECCGRYHLQGFEHYSINYNRFDEAINQLMNEAFVDASEEAIEDDKGDVHNFCGEITLTHYQITREVTYKGKKMPMHEALAKMKWKRVYAFINPNTYNKVYVLMKAGTKASTDIKDER
jgi:hypothetical protein